MDPETAKRHSVRNTTESTPPCRPARDDLRDFIASVNQGPAVIFRWKIERGAWPVVLVTENVNQFGYTAEEFLSGRVQWPKITHPEDDRRLEKEVSDLLERGVDRFSQQYRLFTKSGDLRWVEDWNIVIRDDTGTPAYIQGTVMDITQRKEAERLQMAQEQRLRKLAAKLATAQDEEQKRISEGLHDDVAQLLTACLMHMRTASVLTDLEQARRRYGEAEEIVRDVTGKIRDLSFELGSSTLHRLGLAQGLRELCDQMERRYGVRFVMSHVPDVGVIEEARATVLFKAARELLFNVVKHAGVKEARVSIARTAGRMLLSVEDQGRGFPALATQKPEGASASGGLGLFGIRERLRDVSGSLDVVSEPGIRTRVTLNLPV